jgi:hypothetical protein
MTVGPIVAAAASPDHWLEQLYWASQIGLFVVAIIAAAAAFRQIGALKLFELVKFLQDENFRCARRDMIRKISQKKDTDWWNDPILEASASSCAGHYDIVGRLLRFRPDWGLKRLFIKGWAESIVRTYEILEPFIQKRGAAGGNEYEAFQWLYRQAKKYRPTVGAPWPSQSSKVE